MSGVNLDFKSINNALGKQIELLDRKLSIAIVGLEAIISEGSDNLNIAEKTIQEIKSLNLPQSDPHTEK